MTETVENMILEHLKRFQAGQERIERQMKEVKERLTQVEISVAGVRGDLAHITGDQARQQAVLDTMSERIDRIERRLEIVG
jgi:tetrahydromethanopterin S-methyltransferase subunit G